MHIFTSPSNFSKVSKILLSLLTVLILQTGFTLAQDAPFITVWKTDNPGSSEDNQITIPGTGTDYLIEWEEVGNEANNNGSETGTDEHTITFPSASTYRVKISGDFTRISFGAMGSPTDKEKIVDIAQWGNIGWTNFGYAFLGCVNLNQTATDVPDLSNVTDMRGMFLRASSFNGDISSWDVSNIKVMEGVFAHADSFNMPIGEWNVSNVTEMDDMFYYATSFNQDLSNWNVSNVTSMVGMFVNADLFNQDLNSWDVSNVTNMKSMFWGASSFNQDLSNWDVSSVTTTDFMFYTAIAFNQNIGNWDISKVAYMESMLSGSGISTYNYDLILSGWSTLENININLNLGSGGLEYCLSEEARNLLINEKGWTISGDTKDCQSEFFVSTWKTDNEGISEDNQITIPGTGTNYPIYWEEVDNSENYGHETGNDIHTLTFPHTGTYRIKIYGDFTNIRFANQGDKAKILDIENWGETQWSSMNSTFAGVENLAVSATDIPDLSLVTDMSYIFSDAVNFNSDINNWDVSNVERMAGVFYNATSFNQNLGNWNTSNVTTMSNMFWEAASFNQNLNSWNVANVTNMRSMFRQATAFNGDIGSWNLNPGLNFQNIFYEAESFNQDISNWDVSNISDLSDMFHGASAFNQDLSNWDVSNVTKMTRMFANTAAFNQDLNNWNTANVEEMDFMFWDADAFNGNISDWNTTNVNNMWGMFHNADSFNIDISSWDVSAVTNMQDMFKETISFNQDLSNWNVSNVNEMSGMFYEASVFDQNLGDWDITNVGSLFEFLSNSGLSMTNYDLSLEGWATNGNLPSDIALSAEGLNYCASAEYRQQLIDDFGWNIMGDETCSLAIEETMPAVEATSVEKNTEIYITFDQEIEELDLSGITVKDISGNAISLTDIYIDSLTLHLVHSGLGSNTYEVIIPESSIKSITGKENDSISWSFATQRILSSKDQQKPIEHSAFPNPFSDFTTIQFNLPQTQSVNLLVFDLKGQMVRQEKYDNLGSDKQSIKFEKKDLPAGLYRYQLQSAGGNVGGKMLIK